MAAPKRNMAQADDQVPARLQAKPAKWKSLLRFVEYRGRKITIKLVDVENGFEPAKVQMTATGPMPVSHSHSVTIDKEGYVPKTEAEEAALLKLADKETSNSKGGSLVVLWENREMPEDQRKAELSAADYRKRVDDLESQLADQPALLEENRVQKARLEELERQLAANQGG